MDSNSNYRSAFRGSITDNATPAPPPVKKKLQPRKKNRDMTAQNQAQALAQGFEGMPAPSPTRTPATPNAFSTLPSPAQAELKAGYGRGGFEGVVNTVGSDWYDIPEWQRTQILDKARG